MVLLRVKKYAKNNRNKVSQYHKEYVKRNAERIREYQKAYRQKNRLKGNAYRNLYRKNRRRTDINFKLSLWVRTAQWRLLNLGAKRKIRSLDLLGCSLSDFKKHLENKFQKGMNWKNHSWRGWHIDHIIPLSHFDLRDSEQIKKAAHYSNTQPLWALENLRKNNK